MFLTRKALRKIRLIVGAFCVEALVCFIVFGVFTYLEVESIALAIIGIICLFLAVSFRAIGRYAEGKAKLLANGNKLVLYELRPQIFIQMYNEARDCPDNVISKPDYDVLRVLAAAYDSCGDSNGALEAIEQMILVAKENQKPHAKLLKAAELFDMGKTDEANQLYSEVTNGKMDAMAKMIADIVMKSDRAMAMGDFAVAEAYFKNRLTKKSLPKPNPLEVLTNHFALAELYCKTERSEQAKPHLEYCIKNGGETNIKTKAEDIMSGMGEQCSPA